jgi:GNAT superfamily N-acetyltransferase
MPDGVPAALLVRLAVKQAGQGRGLGSALLRDAVCGSSARPIRSACAHCEPMTLMITVEEVRMMLGRRR